MSNQAPLNFEFKSVPLSELSIFEELTDYDSKFIVSGSFPQVPLLVTKPADSKNYLIIDGYKRYTSFKSKKIEQCLCEIIEFNSIKETGLLRIKLNSHRSLSFKEKFLYITWLKHNENRFSELSQLINITDKERFYLEQLSSAPSRMINACLNGIFDLSVIAELQYYPENDIQTTITFFSMFSFSRQTQKELIEWLPELAFRCKKSISEILQDKVLEEISNNTKLNDPQKIKKIRDHFFNQRFPTIASAKKTWNSIACDINPDPTAISFNTSEAFEKNSLEIKIRISSAQKAIDVTKKLSEIPAKQWETLIYPALLYGVKQK